MRAVGWESPATNDFLLASQMTVTGQLHTCWPDLVGFVNGLPWVVIELEKAGVAARQAFDENVTSTRRTASRSFSGGTITVDWERFFGWKRIER